MTNFEIKNEIKILQEKKRDLLQNTFELNMEAVELEEQIRALRCKCTHVDDDGTSSIDKHSKCRYCGKVIK